MVVKWIRLKEKRQLPKEMKMMMLNTKVVVKQSNENLTIKLGSFHSLALVEKPTTNKDMTMKTLIIVN